MTRDEVTGKLTTVFRETFDLKDLMIEEATTATDVPGWDSLAHINLVLAVEKAFAIKLSVREVRLMKNVGDLIALIEKKAA